ncbi:MAG: hypothetical protein JNL62_01105 [Bryobacterales bacterium]|nr:hypothetical protein [Bryobacterales bacterium]
MPEAWTDDLSHYSSEEILRVQDENRQWYKALRVRVNALIDNKLAKRIGSEEYSAGRVETNKDVAECRRRLQMLINEISDRRRSSATGLGGR